jgi:selenocysteine lyase/cysteine desulfurase
VLPQDPRALFDIPPEVAYLNCAYMSPLPRPVLEAGRAGLERKTRPWQVRPSDFFDEPERARTLFAALVGGDADGVALVPSVSYAIGTAAAGLGLGAGRRVLVLESQFPSNVYPWRATGADVATVPRPPDDDWAGALERSLAAAPAAVVAVPHCHWTDGTLVDLGRVGRAARAHGAALVVDATQSLGAMPLDVTLVQPDFLACAAYKWLLGPYSVAFLWAAPQRRDGPPLEHNWTARVGAEDFAALVDYRDGFRAGARRYDAGERSNFALLPAAVAALDLLLEWGVADIAARIGELTDALVEAAAPLGIGAARPSARAPHLLGLRLPRGAPGDLAARLGSRGIWVSQRGGSLRVSPHVYNDRGDVDRLARALADELEAAGAAG